MEIQGTIIHIGTTDQVSDKFKKRELVIETKENPTYPQYISLESVQDKVNLFDSLKVGDEINAKISIRGRKWLSPKGETKYFNTIEVWSITDIASSIHKKALSPKNSDFVNASNIMQDDSGLPF